MGPELIAIAMVVSAVTGAGVDTLHFGKQIVEIGNWLKGNRRTQAEKDLGNLQSLVSVIHRKQLNRILTLGLLAIVAVAAATFVTGNVIVPESDVVDLGIGLGGGGAALLAGFKRDLVGYRKALLTILRRELRRPILSADEAVILEAYEMAYNRYVAEERVKLKILDKVELLVLDALSPNEAEAMDCEGVRKNLEAKEDCPPDKVTAALDFLRAASLAEIPRSGIGLGSWRLFAKDDIKLKFNRTKQGTEKSQESQRVRELLAEA